jgi:hypothetical protein
VEESFVESIAVSDKPPKEWIVGTRREINAPLKPCQRQTGTNMDHVLVFLARGAQELHPAIATPRGHPVEDRQSHRSPFECKSARLWIHMTERPRELLFLACFERHLVSVDYCEADAFESFVDARIAARESSATKCDFVAGDREHAIPNPLGKRAHEATILQIAQCMCLRRSRAPLRASTMRCISSQNTLWRRARQATSSARSGILSISARLRPSGAARDAT